MYRNKGYVLLNVCVILTVCIILTSCIFKLSLDGMKREDIKEFERNSFNITEKEENFILILEEYINNDDVIKQKIIDKRFSSIPAIRFEGDNVMQATFTEKYIIWKSYKELKEITYERILIYEVINDVDEVYIDLKISNRVN